MRKHLNNEIQISEAELASLTGELREAHHETMPKMRAAAGEWIDVHGRRRDEGYPQAPKTFDRRRFLAMSGIVAAGGAFIAACGSSTPSTNTGAGTTSTNGPGNSGTTASVPVDVQVAGLAASLENLAVATYEAGITAALAGKLGKVPPAVATFATTAMAQHKDHGAAWNAILAAAGYKTVTAPDPVVKSLVDADFAKVTDLVGLANLALTLENVAAATYLNGLTVVSSNQAIATAASIQPVEMQHAAILNFVLGHYPVPAPFATTAGARPLTDYPITSKAS
jgi:hypothetical protein